MAKKPPNLIGKQFGRLTVIRHVFDHGNTKWECKCDCGTIKAILTRNLLSNTVKSCGCLAAELRQKRKLKHGSKKTRLYNVHRAMKQRCALKTSKSYATYGGRGITVAREWENFEPFMQWAIANGYKEGLTLDRIDNNDGYHPLNCRWVSMLTQQRNRRNNVLDEDTVSLIKTLQKYKVKRGEISKQLDISTNLIDSLQTNWGSITGMPL